jgi:hypothetical protein
MSPSAPPLKTRILMTDATPLITLSRADSLDVLFYADLPLFIPDGVFHEATIANTRAGEAAIDAARTLAWQQANAHRVHIVATQTFGQWTQTGQPKLGMGERCASEVVTTLPLAPNERVLMLFQDNGAMRVLSGHDQVIPISTMDYLLALEGEQRIQSAAAIMDEALSPTHVPNRRTFALALSAEEQAAIKATLDQARPIGEIMRRKPGDPAGGGTP